MSFDFNGSTDRVDYNSVFSPRSTAITVAAWVYLDALANISYVWTAHVDDNSTFVAMFYIKTDGTLGFQMENCTPSGRGYVETTASRVGTGAWYHIAASYDNSWNANGIKAYVNGTDYSSGRSLVGATTITGGGKWSIGGRYYDDARNVDGRIAEVGVWKRALSVDEILSLARGYSPYLLPRLLYFAPSLVNKAHDPISNQSGTLDGTAEYQHPNILYAANPVVGRHYEAPSSPTSYPYFFFSRKVLDRRVA